MRVPAAGCEIICYRLTAGQVFLVIIICTPAGGGEFVITSGGASLIKDFDLHGYRRGGTFDSPKVPKSDLGLRPKNPVALLRWIRI